MALKSGFFDSINDDRLYGSEDFADYFASFIGNGIFPNPSDGLQVLESANMQTIVRPGKAWINGYYVSNDSNYTVTHDVADGLLNRIDRIVLRLNYATRQIEIAVKKGVSASTPTTPTIERDADTYELVLADVYITRGTTAIIQANITDQRLNSALCGIAHGLVDQVDTTTIFNQYQSWYNQFKLDSEAEFDTWNDDKRAEFEEWLVSIKTILDENAAANLMNIIDTHKADSVNHVKYGVDTGTANAKAVSINPAPTSYVDGMAIAFKNAVKNTGAATINVNGLGAKQIVKSNGQPLTADYLLPNSIYTIRYNSSTGNFIFQGEGGGLYGNVTPDKVLSGVTFGTDAGEVVGAMPNNGAVTRTLNSGGSYTIPVGYHNGEGRVTVNSLASQTPATALSSQIISGRTAWVNGTQVTGTIPDRGAGSTFTPTTTNKTFPAGRYTSDIVVVGDADLKPVNIRQGANIFGVVGSLVPVDMFAGGIKMLDMITTPYPFVDNQQATSPTYYKLTKDAQINYAGSVRVQFTISSRGDTGLLEAWYAVYKNGVLFKEIYHDWWTYRDNTTYTVDVPVVAGDKISIYQKGGLHHINSPGIYSTMQPFATNL